MALSATVAAPPKTAIHADQAITTSGHATLAFYLADSTTGQAATYSVDMGAGNVERGMAVKRLLQSTSKGKGAREELLRNDMNLGPHLFTLNVSGLLRVNKLVLEPDMPARPGGWRLAVQVELALEKFLVGVASSDVGPLNTARLQLLFSLVGFLVQEQINNDILKASPPMQCT